MRLIIAAIIAVILSILFWPVSEGFHGWGGSRFYHGSGGSRFYPFGRGMSKAYRSEVGWPWYSPGFGWPFYTQNCNLTGCPYGSLCVTDPRGHNSYCAVL